jgi:hypothetical protein
MHRIFYEKIIGLLPAEMIRQEFSFETFIKLCTKYSYYVAKHKIMSIFQNKRIKIINDNQVVFENGINIDLSPHNTRNYTPIVQNSILIDITSDCGYCIKYDTLLVSRNIPNSELYSYKNKEYKSFAERRKQMKRELLNVLELDFGRDFVIEILG